MNRLAGIIVAAVGFVIAVLGVLKFVPGITVGGVMLIVFGGLVIGFSFIKGPDADGVERMSTVSTLGNMFISPGEVFKNLKRHPRWLVALLIMSALSATYGNLFVGRLGADRIGNFTIDKTLEMSFIANNDEAKKKIEEGRKQGIGDLTSPSARTGQALAGFGASFLLYSILALVFFLFALAMGGNLNFIQAISIVIYAGFPVAVIRFILNTTVLFLKDPTDIHPILGQQTIIQDNLNFLVLASEHPVIFTLLGSLSLLMFYWLWMLATGLKNGGEKVSGTIAWSATLAVYGFLIFLGVVSAALFPGFIS